MALPFLRKFTTAGPEGDGRQAYVNADGAFIGCGTPLLERDAYGRWTPRDIAVLEALLFKGYGAPVSLDAQAGRLRSIAEALNKGDLALAGVSLVFLQLPPLPSDAQAQAMAEADDLLAKYNPQQPRAPKGDPDGGQWIGGKGAGGGHAPGAHETGSHAGIILAADVEDPTHAKKRLFVEAHLAAAQKAADKLHMPVENILGISALESNWGKHRFASVGNNYFGIHYPSPRAHGFIAATQSPNVKMSTFKNYAEAAEEFSERYKTFIDGVKDPEKFARILQAKAKFAIDGNGKPIPAYAKEVAATARSLRALIGRHDI